MEVFGRKGAAMLALFSKVKPGDPIKASEWNKLVDCLRALVIQPGAGIRVTRTPSGTTLAIVPQSQGAPPVSLPHPFKVFVVKDDDDGTKVQVAYGTVNGIEPTINGTWLHNIQPTPPTLTVDDGTTVYLKANLNEKREVRGIRE